jgi:hypothetical protein
MMRVRNVLSSAVIGSERVAIRGKEFELDGGIKQHA